MYYYVYIVPALHHNNCMYVAHHLLTLGHQFRPNLPPPLKEGAATFIDLVPKLRRLGTESFLHQLTKQRDLILEYLTGAQGTLKQLSRYKCDKSNTTFINHAYSAFVIDTVSDTSLISVKID